MLFNMFLPMYFTILKGHKTTIFGGERKKIYCKLYFFLYSTFFIVLTYKAMKVEKIQMIGFKSFVDKMEFTFETGITGIVGPNGVGKSNICYAFRWVLGEQNARSLRGSRMEDVIFHGSKDRSPVGMSEISILFDNEDGFIPLEYKQIEETRRLYRSGESEYFFNRMPCRLKDINETFMDTGIGMAFYSVLEQGQI